MKLHPEYEMTTASAYSGLALMVPKESEFIAYVDSFGQAFDHLHIGKPLFFTESAVNLVLSAEKSALKHEAIMYDLGVYGLSPRHESRKDLACMIVARNPVEAVLYGRDSCFDGVVSDLDVKEINTCIGVPNLNLADFQTALLDAKNHYCTPKKSE